MILIGAVFAASLTDWWAQRCVGQDDQGDVSLAATANLRLSSGLEPGRPTPSRWESLADRIGFSDSRDIFVQLIAASYAKLSGSQSLMLACDPANASLYDLYYKLGLAATTETKDKTANQPQRQPALQPRCPRCAVALTTPSELLSIGHRPIS